MRANELMIGDWVYSTFSDKPCKVVGIEQYESEYVNVKATNVTGAKDINSIYFIPLTAEILEKNGFGNTAAKDEKFLYMGKKQVWVDLKKDKHWVNVKYDDDNRNLLPFHYYEGYISYVHELQHALRLCGIDKEIVL